MTDTDDTRRQALRKAARRTPNSSRSYDGLLKYLGVTLYQERNRRRREDEKPDDRQER